MELHTQLLAYFPNNKTENFHHGLTYIKYAAPKLHGYKTTENNRRTEKDPKSSERVTLLHTGCRLNRRY